MEETMEDLLEGCYRFCDKVVGINPDMSKDDVMEQVKMDLLDFGICLAQQEGKIGIQQLVTIKQILKTDYDENLNKKLYSSSDSLLKEFWVTIPKSMTLFVMADKDKSAGCSTFYSNARNLYKTFKLFGNIVLTSNGSRLKAEVEALDTYCNTLIQYILKMEANEELEFIQKKEKKKSLTVHKKDYMFNVDDLFEEIDHMVGLEEVKTEVHNLVNLIIVRKYRQERGIKIPPMAMHLVFVGNPGTGKTTIARKMAQMYKELGILEKGHLIETDRAGLVAGYMGQTASKVDQVVDSALGGILFIDEAYSLTSNKGEGDYGQEAVDTLLKRMEDDREKFIVIVAGYPEEMEEFLSSNPGLRSRFNKYITFKDYNEIQLLEIFRLMCKEYDYNLSTEAVAKLEGFFINMVRVKEDNFANAREVRNLFEKVISNQANRLMADTKAEEWLQTISAQDIPDWNNWLEENNIAV